jgi:hypothetical protein
MYARASRPNCNMAQGVAGRKELLDNSCLKPTFTNTVLGGTMVRTPPRGEFGVRARAMRRSQSQALGKGLGAGHPGLNRVVRL